MHTPRITLAVSMHDFIGEAVKRVEAASGEETVSAFTCNACGEELDAYYPRHGLGDNLTRTREFVEHVAFGHAGRADVLTVRTSMLFAITD